MACCTRPTQTPAPPGNLPRSREDPPPEDDTRPPPGVRPMPRRPELRQAVVTGASSGLGRELVRQLVRDRGMTVLATARRLDRLESLAEECPPGRVLSMAGDLSDAEFRRALWRRAEALPGGVNLLVNNAGVGHYAALADQDFGRIRQIFELNL